MTAKNFYKDFEIFQKISTDFNKEVARRCNISQAGLNRFKNGMVKKDGNKHFELIINACKEINLRVLNEAQTVQSLAQ